MEINYLGLKREFKVIEYQWADPEGERRSGHPPPPTHTHTPEKITKI